MMKFSVELIENVKGGINSEDDIISGTAYVLFEETKKYEISWSLY